MSRIVKCPCDCGLFQWEDGRPIEVDMLVHNLALGAALCRAYHQGLAYQPYPPSPTREPFWSPGCGRSAP